MLTNRCGISRQAGVSVIEMPIIALILLTLMLFSVKRIIFYFFTKVEFYKEINYTSKIILVLEAP